MSHPKQRLVLYLDGTWNTEDDSTNVRNIYHRTLEGRLPAEEGKQSEKWIQKRYYDRGVGTGMFDKVLGGALGLGLEVNVREAYNWLVDHYNDGDEVYIFGFSRGAYTARSLVSFIAYCGLVERGAPLTITQLWKGYTFISRNRGRSKDWWQETVKQEKNRLRFRRITSLKRDAGRENDEEWEIEKPENLNSTEKLLEAWSRRIKITYLGIYDSVGALGIHFLGVTGVRSRLDEAHNQYPSRIMEKCRHGMAIDENRTSFRLTPILNYVRNNLKEDKIDDEINRYKNIIDQKWFVGAHSNIGGGYPNNKLSMRPLQWLLEGASLMGLQIRDLPAEIEEAMDKAIEGCKAKNINDSYTDFAFFIWPHLLREKRNHREIKRPDLVRNNYTLRPVHEEIDHTVIDLAERDDTYVPPSLLAYARGPVDRDIEALQSQEPSQEPKREEAIKRLQKIKNHFVDKEPRQQWPGDIYKGKSMVKGWLFLILWSVLAAFGMELVLQVFFGSSLIISPLGLSLLAALFVLIDWTEARSTLVKALVPQMVIPRTIWNIAYWLRLIGVLAFFVGLISTLTQLGRLITASGLMPGKILNTIRSLFWSLKNGDFWPWLKSAIVGLAQDGAFWPWLVATAMVLGLATFGKKWFLKIKPSPQPEKAAPLAIAAASPTEQPKTNEILMWIAGVIALVAFYLFCKEHCSHHAEAYAERQAGQLAGQLLFSYILLVGIGAIFKWIGTPMGPTKANLGSMVTLQHLFTPAQHTQLFNYWSDRLTRNWDHKRPAGESGWVRMKAVVSEGLWRDMLGFVPFYTLFFCIILSIGLSGLEQNQCELLTAFELDINGFTIHWWITLVIIVAIADIIENAIHLLSLKKYPHATISQGLLSMGNLFTFVKFVGFFFAMLLTIFVYLTLIWEVFNASSGGDWRWLLATGISYALLLMLLFKGLTKIFKS